MLRQYHHYKRIVRRVWMIAPLFQNQFAVTLFEYDSLHFLQKELLRIAYTPMRGLTPMKYGTSLDPARVEHGL